MQYDEQVQQQMFSMIEGWQRSGLSQKSYCEQSGIRYHVFHYWYKRYRTRQTPASEGGFISLHLQPAGFPTAGNAGIELLLADGRRLLFHQGVSPDFLKTLIS